MLALLSGKQGPEGCKSFIGFLDMASIFSILGHAAVPQESAPHRAARVVSLRGQPLLER